MSVKLLKFSKDIRQGDVLLRPVETLPAGCTAESLASRIVLAHGEVTGHAHAIYDHHGGRLTEAEALIDAFGTPEAAAEIAEAAIARAKARLWIAPSGDRYLEVTEPVTLKHEEHTEHTIDPGIYELPIQVEHTAGEMVRQVAD